MNHRQAAHGTASLIWEAIGSLGEGECHEGPLIPLNGGRSFTDAIQIYYGKTIIGETRARGTNWRLLRYFRAMRMGDMNPGRICGNGEVSLGNRYSKMESLRFVIRL